MLNFIKTRKKKIYPRRKFRQLTSKFCTLPNFICIGAQRSGSTSLFKYISQHPQVIPNQVKEVHYFDLNYSNYSKSIQWYKSFFPTRIEINFQSLFKGKRIITGESSPYYIFHPDVPRRIHTIIPDVKLIAVLRNPVERAYSHWCHEKREGRETLSFAEAIDKENRRLQGESQKLSKDINYYSFAHHRFAYIRSVGFISNS